jgi:uncharacterized protein YjbI with pentapeptide repeats
MSTKFSRRRTLRVTAFTALLVLGSLLFFNYSTRVGAQNGVGSGTRLLRTPTVSATQIGFAYANNIWVVPRDGGSALDQLNTGLLLEENRVVFDKMLWALEQIIPNNLELSARHLYDLNMKLQSDMADSLTQFFVARGLASIDHKEHQSLLKDAEALTDCSESALDYMYENLDTGLKSFAGALETFNAMDKPQKQELLIHTKKRLTHLKMQMRGNVRLCARFLEVRPKNGAPHLYFRKMYLEQLRCKYGTSLSNVDLVGARMKGADLVEAKLERVRFDYADLSNASFVNADLTKTRFRSVDLTNTRFMGAQFSDSSDFTHSNWWQADFENASESGRTLLSSKIEELNDEEIQEAHRSVREFLKDQSEAISNDDPAV